ncbi:MAG TPA: helix-turn-helix transcriptional regulator [Conexibacter sp.]|jgi:DNA-binding XRE family transcriptional regulator
MARITTHDDLLKRRPITPADREAIDEIKRAMELQVRLHDLRKRRGVTQNAVAEQLGTSRPNVARIESEEDVRVTTLERYVRALGGRLEVRAVFADESVTLAD